MPATVWKDTMYVTAYEQARTGATDAMIAGSLGVATTTFSMWKETKPALRDALNRGRTSAQNVDSFKSYIAGKLPENLHPIWEQIMILEECGSPVHRFESLLTGQGVRARQWLFVHALIHSNFIKSTAMRLAGVTEGTLAGWLTRDLDFLELLNFITEAKKDFFEAALIHKVRQGDTAAVIFAAKTQLRDRGYGEKVEVQHTGTVTHRHIDTPVDVAALGLDEGTLQALADALIAAGITPQADGGGDTGTGGPIYTTGTLITQAAQ